MLPVAVRLCFHVNQSTISDRGCSAYASALAKDFGSSIGISNKPWLADPLAPVLTSSATSSSLQPNNDNQGSVSDVFFGRCIQVFCSVVSRLNLSA